jgi:hypothetical protein
MNRSFRGLTTLEIILATGLLSVVILGMIAVFMGGLKLMSGTELRTRASNVGAQVLESISERGGHEILPDEDLVFSGAVPDPMLEQFPPAPYPSQEEFTISVETRILSARTTAVLVIVAWDTGNVRLERVFNEVD